MPSARPERSETLDAELFEAVSALDLPGWYYPLCDAFPRREGDYSPQGEAMRAAWTATGLSVRASGKRAAGAVIGGRGRNMRAMLFPARYCGMFDVHVELHDAGRLGGNTLHSWALTLTRQAGQEPPDPPYPRPWAMSDDEIVPIAQRVGDHLVAVAGLLEIGVRT